MAKPEPKIQAEQGKKQVDSRSKSGTAIPPQHKEPELKGAFASVMLLGAFLVLTWVGAYVLFISRG
ncbi:cytochrome c oxidase subunit 2A [Paenibacillus silviterrae]|uniref:cytochrome c oxidase subunit 2A n=1 Tax=Paenibacillus silviterrae TaxID=3242194 RepID=UPI0035566EA2